MAGDCFRDSLVFDELSRGAVFDVSPLLVPLVPVDVLGPDSPTADELP